MNLGEYLSKNNFVLPKRIMIGNSSEVYVLEELLRQGKSVFEFTVFETQIYPNLHLGVFFRDVWVAMEHIIVMEGK